jgi:TRAP-type C4-dicarboxylate transport system permease small subunit
MMYHRVFGDTPDVRAYGVRFRTLLVTMLLVVAACFVSSLLVTIFACLPVPRNWDKTISGRCVATVPWWYSYAALNISTDLIILAMPLPLINGLMQIQRRQKMVLMGIFMLGGLYVCSEFYVIWHADKSPVSV